MARVPCERSPSPLNGERAGVRGANGPLRSTPLAAFTPQRPRLPEKQKEFMRGLRFLSTNQITRPLISNHLRVSGLWSQCAPVFGIGDYKHATPTGILAKSMLESAISRWK